LYHKIRRWESAVARDKSDLKRLLLVVDKRIAAADAQVNDISATLAEAMTIAEELRKARTAIAAAMGGPRKPRAASGYKLPPGIAPPMRKPEGDVSANGANGTNGTGAKHSPRKREYRYRPLEGGELTRDGIVRLRDLIQDSKMERLLLALKAHPEGLSDEELQDPLNLKNSSALAGITGALSKNAVKAGIGKEFVSRQRAMVGTRIGWRFSLTPEFRGYMDEIGWRERIKLTPV
jgi:hypothetical protein